jgi:hypothetical protein
MQEERRPAPFFLPGFFLRLWDQLPEMEQTWGELSGMHHPYQRPGRVPMEANIPP